MNLQLPMNDKWSFFEAYSNELHTNGYSGGCEVRLPHNVRELPFSYCNEDDYQMMSAYRRELFAPLEWQGKSVRICFEGAAHKSELYLNGQLIKTHGCGYTSFTAELSNALKIGESNILVLKLDSREADVPPFGKVIDYLTYGGIYREVSLIVSEHEYVSDIFVYTPEVSAAKSRVFAEISINSPEKATVIKAELYSADGVLVKLLGEPGANECIKLEAEIENAALWACDSPTLYTLKVSLIHNNEADVYETRFGFRTCRFEADGFYLNGIKTKLFGLNRHQSWPYIGYAMPKRAQRLDAEILKRELGLNAVRTSHYPQSKHFINACDELGLLVFTEIPGWQHIGNDEWKAQAIQNTRDMIMQYRNHPSIILWGVRINESIDDDEFYKKTNKEAHLLDETRQTGGVRCITKSSFLEDVYTYNDFFHNGTNAGLLPKSAVTPDTSRGYLVSEYGGHMFPTKSYDDERHRLSNALRHLTVINAACRDGIAGSFGWCAFDYNTHKDFGSGDRICHHGVMDMFRNPKPSAYVYQSQADGEPVLFVSSEMNIGDHPVDGIGTVYAFTNADSVRIYKNEEQICELTAGEQFSALKHPPVYTDDFIGDLLLKNEGYSKNTSKKVKRALRAIAKYGQNTLPWPEKLNVASLMLLNKFTIKKGVELFGKYIASWGCTSLSYRFEAVKNGKVVKSVKKEPVYKTSLIANADTLTLHEGETYDVATVRLTAVDQNQNTLYYCMDAVEIEVSGCLEIIGPSCASLRGGMGGTYLKTTGTAGKAEVKFKAPCGECKLSFDVFKI